MTSMQALEDAEIRRNNAQKVGGGCESRHGCSPAIADTEIRAPFVAS